MSYNATLWRLYEGRVLSVSVVELDASLRIVRWNGSQCHPLAGTPAYHDHIVAELGEFCGKPAALTVSNGTKGFESALRKSFDEAWAAQFQRPIVNGKIAS